MLRISIPPGETFAGIQGPFSFVADSYTLGGVVETSGEWLVTPAGPQRQSEWLVEQTTVAVPLGFAFLTVSILTWLRRSLLCLAFLSPFALASAAQYRLDVIPTCNINYPSTLSGNALRMWLFYPATGQVADGVAVTKLESVNNKPTKFATSTAVTSSQNFYAIITNNVSTFASATKLKWLDPYEVGSGTEPQQNEYGNYAGEQPTNEAGIPISDPSNPTPDPSLPNKAAVNFANPFPNPATPILTVRPKDGSPAFDVRQPTLQPGQSFPLDFSYPKEFDWEVGWDLGDGRVVYPGGSGNSGTSVALPVGSPTPPSGGDSKAGAITTPPLATPTPSPTGDVAAAVNRHAGLTQAYGEAARTAANITNNNLDSLEDLFGKAVAKLNSIDSKTGTGAGGTGGAVTVEGDALAALEGIEAGLNGTVTAPDVPTLANPAGFDTIGNDNKSSQVSDIRGDMAELGTALQGVVSSVGLGANYASAPLSASFTVLGRSYTMNLEAYSWVFDTMRAVFLGMISLNFVWRLLRIVRGAFVN